MKRGVETDEGLKMVYSDGICGGECGVKLIRI